MPIITPSTNGAMPEAKKTGRKESKADIKPAEKAPSYVPNIPEPNTRAELMEYWMDFTLDDRTSQRVLWLSEGGAKVSRMCEEMCPVLDRPERYEHSPQVLCKECVWGNRGYWEVDCEGWVVIGAACESSARKTKDGPCGLGENDVSWGLGWAGSCYHVWHNGVNIEVHAPFCPTIGIYADQPAGLLNFYSVEAEENGSKVVNLLYQFKTTINEKLYPGFWVGRKSHCWIRKKDQ
ncbi:tripartite motif-containing protein 16 isoform X1 [Misgurnus anguillicaudatus]|uniref:tripartite motif-containing protein 16 isoform X1 n=1 Tax=Misgurnus anguillicaudatus TaxID=75329 RepID=UPI0024358F23|nr:tripartite motif-containing protein 16-like protein [Misgurnus anguillicaudatus]